MTATELSRFASPESYTPRHLAEKILTSRAALEGERKQVTVLFCDIAGSTALAERIGPEAMHGLLNRFFELALAEVHRHEGTINQFLGDGFMALFGAPLAHENHARCAAFAALGIREALQERRAEVGGAEGVRLTVRIGLNTGFVVVGKIGDNLRMDYTAIGARSHLEEAARRARQVGMPGVLARSLLGLGLLSRAKGQIEEARRYLHEARALAEPLGSPLLDQRIRAALSALPA
ncbi:MAG: adenylate/guanylate cyclase domain-containing protein [candidate division NC10 bacterium]